MHQNITQNVFGRKADSTSSVPVPAPFTPSRRVRPARSRTPTSVRRTERTATLTDPYMPPEALAIQDQRESFDPSQPSAPHPGDGESAPNNAAGWLTPHGLDPSPPQALPDQPVDLTGDDDDGQPDLSRIVPTTPEGIADEPLPQLPAKRPFDALKADVSARMNAPGSFELYGYQSDFARPFRI